MNDSIQPNDFKSADIAAAFSLLSRLPVPVDHHMAANRAAQATWAYPLVGAVLGALAATIGSVILWLGAPTGMAAAGSLATLVLLSGGLHEDGLADCADGLGGGSSRERCLEIMKDSNIGAFGAVALIIVLIARWSGLDGLSGAGALFWPLIAVGAVSRLPMVLALFLMSSARKSGLAADVGRPPTGSAAVATGLALAIALFATGWAGFLIFGTACLASLPLFYLAQRRIGGHTGDVLGASQQLVEIAALATVLTLL